MQGALSREIALWRRSGAIEGRLRTIRWMFTSGTCVRKSNPAAAQSASRPFEASATSFAKRRLREAQIHWLSARSLVLCSFYVWNGNFQRRDVVRDARESV